MSFILRSSKPAINVRLFAACGRPALAGSQRTFTSSNWRLLKETNTDRPDLAEENEKHKQDQLKKSKEGKGHWKPELASDSEEAVAADRHEHSDHSDGGIEKLQKKTQHRAEEKHKAGTSQSSGLD